MTVSSNRYVREGFKARSPEVDDEIVKRVMDGQSPTFIVRNMIVNMKSVQDVMKERGIVSAGHQARLDAKVKKQKEEERQVKLLMKAAKRQAEKINRMDPENVDPKVKEAAELMNAERRAKYDELRRTRMRQYSKLHRQRKKEEAALTRAARSTDMWGNDAYRDAGIDDEQFTG